MLIELSRREREAGIKLDPEIDAFMKAIVLSGQKSSFLTDYVLKMLGLDICADIMVGDEMRRGISGGQKKRVTTGEMVVWPAQALFMDEISTGLDSSTTFRICKFMRQVVHILDATVIVSLLQPAPETFELFDDIILLSEGQIVYQAPSASSYDAPGHSSTTMSYSADGTRLFSCGTNKEGESFLVEWNESEGAVKRTYHGLGNKRCREGAVKRAFLVITIGAFPSTNVAVGTSLADRTPPVAAMVGLNNDSRSLADVKPRIVDEAVEKSRIWKLTEINEQSQCRSLKLPDGLSSMRVSRLIYTNQGVAILALAANAVHKLWKWQKNDRNTSGKATASLQPQLWQPSSGILMTNEIGDTNPEDAVSCFALSKNDSYVMSASGGKISLFNMMTFKTMTTFMPPPPAATFLAFHPQDNNIIAIGMDDSSIQIYNVRVDEVKTKLKGHQKRITGLAFSHVLNILVSSGADSQLCVWSTDGWEKQTNKFLQMPNGRAPAPLADTRVQFHLDQTHLLAVHETQIAIYEAPKLECLKQWVPREASGPITHATYSCDSQSIYVSFEDGSVGVLTASTLRLRCRINQTAYLNPNPSLRVFPLVIAAHPSESNQFALGLTDGGVHVLEPLESEGRWGSPPPTENGVGPSTPSGASVSEQPQR